MNTPKLPLIIACCLLSISISAADINFRTLTIAQAITEAETQDKHLFITYEADWCLPCQIMEETVFTHESVVTKLNTDFVSIKVNFDEVNDKEWFGQYDVSSIPTLSVVDDAGQELTRHEGTMNLATFIAFLESNTKPSTPVAPKMRVIAAQYSSPPSTEFTTIQFGAFSKIANAQQQQQSIESLLSISTIITQDESGLYKLLYTNSITREERKIIVANANYNKIDFFIK